MMKTTTNNQILTTINYALTPVTKPIAEISPCLIRNQDQLIHTTSGKAHCISIVDTDYANIDIDNNLVHLTEVGFMSVESEDQDKALVEANYRLNNSNFAEKYLLLEDLLGAPILLSVVNVDISYSELVNY